MSYSVTGALKSAYTTHGRMVTVDEVKPHFSSSDKSNLVPSLEREFAIGRVVIRTVKGQRVYKPAS